jgi:hypothetical protein
MSKPQSSGKLPWGHELAAYFSLGLLALTGIAWLVLDKWVRVEGAFGPEHHPAQAWALILHGVLAYAFLIVAGMLAPVHMRLGWSAGRNRGTGIALATISLVLAVTGLLLYYAAAERLRSGASLVHWSVGLGGTVIFLLHALRGRHASSSSNQI